MAQIISELLYSAIFWGSLGTTLVWWFRRRSRHRVVRGILLFPLGWIALHTAFAWYGFVIPPSGRLIDADTGQPHTNRRVIATWISYPLALWTSYCSGRQAHLTDTDGDISFRFAPWPTLVFGTFVRGLNPEILGRIDNRALEIFPFPLTGNIPVDQYAPERDISWGPNTECKKQIAVQYSDSQILPGEANQFDALRREACIVGNAWTLTDLFMQDLSRGANRYASGGAPPLEIQEILRTFGQHGCRPGEGGVCVQAISKGTRDQLCAYYMTIRGPQDAVQ
jgi:hypothetical protein